MEPASQYFARLEKAEAEVANQKRKNKIMAECLEMYRLDAMHCQLVVNQRDKTIAELKAELLVARPKWRRVV